MSIPKNEPNKFDVNDGQGDFFKDNSYTNNQDVNAQPSYELPKGEFSVYGETVNPDHELVQLAFNGKFTQQVGKLLGFDSWSVLGKSQEIISEKKKILNQGVDEQKVVADKIVLDNNWNSYIDQPEGSSTINLNEIDVDANNIYHQDSSKILLNDIKTSGGQKRQPISLLQLPNGRYQILDGENIVNLGNKNNWENVPARVFTSQKEYNKYKKLTGAKGNDELDFEHFDSQIISKINNDKTVNNAGSGLANNKGVVDQVDGSATTTEFLKKAESDRKFYSVGGDVKNGKNIFGENMFSNAEAENIAVGIKQKVQVKPDEEGNLIDFRAYGLDGGKPNPQDQKIPDENSVYFAMNEISKNGNYKERINEGNRAKVTQEATIKLANLIGIDPEKLKKTIQGRHSGGVIVGDQMGLAETMLAARQLLVNETALLDKLAAKAINGTDADKLAFKTQLELVAQLQAHIKGSQTEIARALAQFKIPTRSADGTNPLASEDISQILSEHGGSDGISDTAKMYLQAGDTKNRMNFAREVSKYKKIGDALYESWINILLSSPVTHIKNVSGAFLQIFAHSIETAVQVGVNRTGMMLGGSDSGVRFSDVNAQVFGIMMSLQDAWKAAGNGLKYGDKVIAGSKLDNGGKVYREKAFSMEGTGGFATAVNGLGRVMTLDRIPTRALEWEDNFFKTMASRQFIYEQAMRTGRNKGLEGDALASHIAEFVTNPPPDVLKGSDAHARYVTLQTDLDQVGKNLAGIRNNALMRYFVPFFKTPYNATKYALIERSFLSSWSSTYKQAKIRAESPNATMDDKIQFQKMRTKMHMGNATAMTIGFLTAQGLVTGAGPTDPDLRKSLIRTGWKPYSIKVGDSYYSYQGAEPFASILGLAADASETMFDGSLPEGEDDKLAMAMMVMLSNQVTDKTFMQGFSQLVSTISDPQRYGGGMVESYIRSLVPRVFALGEKIQDPSVRYARGLVDNLKSQVPWLSNDLEPRRNVWGMKIMVGDTFGPAVLSPIYVSHLGENYRNDTGTAYMPDRGKRAYALDVEFVDRDNGIWWSPKPHAETISHPTAGAIELGDKEISVFHQVSGMFLIEELENAMKTDEYKILKQQFLASDRKSDLVKDKLYSLLDLAQLQAKRRATEWMFTNDESPFKDQLNLDIDKIIEEKNMENEVFKKDFKNIQMKGTFN